MHAFLEWATRSATVFMLIGGTPAWAVVAGVDSAVINLGNNGGTITAVTIDGTLFADLTLPTSATADNVRTAWNNDGGTEPVDASTAFGNAVVTDGLLNTNATVQFGRTIALDEMLVFMDIESAELAETVAIFPVDSSGAKIGDYSLTLSNDGAGKSDQYGPPLIPGDYDLKIVDVVDPLAGFNVLGISFTLGDLSGTTGNLGLAEGFRVEDNFNGMNVDPSFAAIAAVLPPNTDFVAPAGTGIEDFHVLRSNYLESGLTQPDGDANGDGVANHIDYYLWRTDFLENGGSMAGLSLSVPEPPAVWMLLGGLALLVHRRMHAGRRPVDPSVCFSPMNQSN